MNGTVYTETLVYIAPEAFQKDIPYQVVIVTLADGSRITGRIQGDRVRIDDPVVEITPRDGVRYFRKQS